MGKWCEAYELGLDFTNLGNLNKTNQFWGFRGLWISDFEITDEGLILLPQTHR